MPSIGKENISRFDTRSRSERCPWLSRHANAGLSFLLLLYVAGFGFIGDAVAQPTLQSVQQIRHLNATALASSPDVHIRGVVTYYDAVVPNLFVQDKTGGIWVDLRGLNGDAPKPGQILDLRGHAAAGFAPYIANPQWSVVGSSGPPAPIHVSYEDATTGAFDSQWVEIDGVVRSFSEEAEGDVLVIDVATPTGSFKVRVPAYRSAFPMQFVDAKVRFRGVCGTAFNRRDQLVGIHLFMPDLNEVQILEPAPADPFNVAPTPVADISRFSADLSDIRRIKVVGTITAVFPGRGIYLMDQTGGLYAQSHDGTPAHPGDEVEVIGFPSVGTYTPVLKSASFRPTGKHHQIVPTHVTAQTALKGSYDAQLISISGIVREYRQHRNAYTPVIESDDHVSFEAVLLGQSEREWLAPVGSRVALTGVCSVKVDENRNPSDFQIVLRTPDDIKILQSPPWLTATRALSLVFFLGSLTLAITTWVLILRKRVRQQTEIIRTKLENEASLQERYQRIFERNLTGLYIARPNGHIIDCNDACAHILGFSSRQELLENRAAAEQITTKFYDAQASSQIVNAEHRFQRFDGRLGWVLSNARCVPQKNAVENVIEGGLVDITDRKIAEERIQFLAYYDSLTGLPNRTLLQDRLAKVLAGAKRHKDRVAVLFLDLDRFKNINDSLGHSYGDLLLQELATRLQTWAREQDTVARLGGDEFIVVLSAIKEVADAAVAAERVAHAISAEFTLQGRVLNVTCSIGISIYPDHGEDPETLIKHADAALYRAKEGGRNTFRYFTREMNAEVLDRLTLESSLHTALEKQQLFLMYQPQFDVATRAITCCEALVRWQHPDHGVVPPDKFIGIAENSGMIVPIGEWVMRTACLQAKTWQEKNRHGIPVAVNVSAVQFRQDGFCDMVKRVLRDTGLNPRWLELELTESLLLSNEDVMFHVLGELQSMGVKLAIDDFGTGYSSLNYLKRLPVSKLKIDRTFIQDLAKNSDDAAITTAIINMAKCLNLKVTAEGVETDAQLQLLRQYGCDQAQGYLFGKPLDDIQVKAKLQEHSAAVALAGKSS